MNGFKARYTGCRPTSGGIRRSCLEQDPNATVRSPCPLSSGHCCTAYRGPQASCGSRMHAWCIKSSCNWGTTDTFDRPVAPLWHGSSIGFEEFHLCRPCTGILWGRFGTSLIGLPRGRTAGHHPGEPRDHHYGWQPADPEGPTQASGDRPDDLASPGTQFRFLQPHSHTPGAGGCRPRRGPLRIGRPPCQAAQEPQGRAAPHRGQAEQIRETASKEGKES